MGNEVTDGVSYQFSELAGTAATWKGGICVNFKTPNFPFKHMQTAVHTCTSWSTDSYTRMLGTGSHIYVTWLVQRRWVIWSFVWAAVLVSWAETCDQCAQDPNCAIRQMVERENSKQIFTVLSSLERKKKQQGFCHFSFLVLINWITHSM